MFEWAFNETKIMNSQTYMLYSRPSNFKSNAGNGSERRGREKDKEAGVVCSWISPSAESFIKSYDGILVWNARKVSLSVCLNIAHDLEASS